MRKKKLVKRVAGIALTVGVVILAIVCVGKVNRRILKFIQRKRQE